MRGLLPSDFFGQLVFEPRIEFGKFVADNLPAERFKLILSINHPAKVFLAMLGDFGLGILTTTPSCPKGVVEN